ncbi:MAG: hypothetical protein Q7T39_23325 [Polaromonas sp.]|nr:hypothetical protein [Polaromonas sp.]
MATNKILSVTNKLFALLEPLEDDERARAIQATFVMLGSTPVTFANTGGGTGAGTAGASGNQRGFGTAGNEKTYFDTKKPANKIEELAVAARFREETAGATTSTKQELSEVIKGARRDFDANNYGRDLANAKTKGIFNKGNGTDVVLSHYGQSYVDALPDREAVKVIGKPKKAGAKRPAAKRAAKNKLGK